MARIRQAIKCRAHKTSGDPCPNWAMNGQYVCHAHGGRSPQAKRAAERRELERKALALFFGTCKRLERDQVGSALVASVTAEQTGTRRKGKTDG